MPDRTTSNPRGREIGAGRGFDEMDATLEGRPPEDTEAIRTRQVASFGTEGADEVQVRKGLRGELDEKPTPEDDAAGGTPGTGVREPGFVAVDPDATRPLPLPDEPTGSVGN